MKKLNVKQKAETCDKSRERAKEWLKSLKDKRERKHRIAFPNHPDTEESSCKNI